MAAPLEPTPSRDYNAILFAAAAAATAIPLSPPRIAPAASSPPGGDAPDLRATCRLHCPGSLYTRNSEGYYSTYSASCNGCSVGIRETAENAAADRVRDLQTQLTAIWATEHGRHTAEHAETIAADLRAAIAALNAASTVITTPQQYADRMLTAHAAATELDELLVEAAVRDPTVTLRHHITVAMERLRNSNRHSDPTTWPIWSAATEMLASLDDHAADDSY
jgi:hypothetical protein